MKTMSNWWLDNKEKHDEIINTFQSRARLQGYKTGTKKFTMAQQEFFIGACTALGGIPPSWLFSIMRGEEICLPEDVQAGDTVEG